MATNLLMPRLTDERGVALPLALIALLVLGTLSAALLAVGSSEVRIASNHLGSTQAHFLAEAGLEDAFNYFRANPSALSSNVPAALTNVPGLAGPGPTLATVGGYAVQYRSAGTSSVLVVATGTGGSGAQKTLRAILSNQFTSNFGVLTGGDLTISGNSTIDGSCGSVHSNGNLTVTGNASVSGGATASGTYNGSSAPPGGQPTQTIPAVVPSNFLASAKQTLAANSVYQMKSDGRILDGNDSVIHTLSSGQSYRGWKYTAGSPAKWEYDDNRAYDGTYYLEGNVKASKNVGTASTPWKTTLIATGDIEVSGKPVWVPHLLDTLLVAGLDIKMSGDSDLTVGGLVAAHEQIQISGNPVLTGYVLAEDASSTSGTVTQNDISGKPPITYDCGLIPPGLQGNLVFVAWGL